MCGTPRITFDTPLQILKENTSEREIVLFFSHFLMLGSEQQYCHQEKHKTQIAAKIYNADANH